MKTKLNLATKPFGHSRLFWLGSGVGGGALLAIAGMLVLTFIQNREAPPEIQEAEAKLSAELRGLTTEESKLLGELRADGTTDTIDRSHFLNQLLTRLFILEGFEIIFNGLDDGLKIIRNANGKKDAAQGLIKRFELHRDFPLDTHCLHV